ncbi:hypothetical protein BGX23_011202, partial [Mortierella sp. AD031]
MAPTLPSTMSNTLPSINFRIHNNSSSPMCNPLNNLSRPHNHPNPHNISTSYPNIIKNNIIRMKGSMRNHTSTSNIPTRTPSTNLHDPSRT